MTDDMFGNPRTSPEKQSRQGNSGKKKAAPSYGASVQRSKPNGETGFSDDEVYITRPRNTSAPPDNDPLTGQQTKSEPKANSNGMKAKRGTPTPTGDGRSVSGKKVPPKKKRKKKKRRKWPYILLIFFLFVIGGFFYVWNSAFFQNDTDAGSAGLNPEIAGAEQDVVNILFLGIDNDEGRRENMLTDTIMVLSVDCKNGQANVLQIPRDTYIGTEYTATGKINALYSSNSEYSGIEGLSNFIYENLGIPLDHYATITMEGLRNVIDAIGGVTIDVPYEVDLDGVVLEPGVQTLDGNESEKFIRQRHGKGYENGDLDRLKVQRLFMASLVEQFLGTSKSTLLTLLPKLSGEISTDMTTGEMVDLLSKVSGMPADSIGFYMVPGQSAYVNTKAYGQQSVYSIHKQPLVDLINQYFLAGREPITVDDILLPELDNDEDAFDDVGGNVNQILGNESDETVEPSSTSSGAPTSSSSQTSSAKGSTSSGKSSQKQYD